jgi:hypothetical protein
LRFSCPGRERIQSSVGCLMIRFKVIRFLPVLLLTVLSLAGCSGPFKGGVNPPGTATVSLTLVSHTPPASPSLLSYKVTILSVTLTPTTGTAFTFTPSPAPVIELMRLQSDTAFLGTLLKVPAGTYSNITVSLGSPQITFLNNTSVTITNASSASGSCTVNAICTISPNATGLPKVSTTPFPITVSANTQIGLGIDFNLSNSITITGGTMTVTFTPATAGVNVLSAFDLPRANANLGTNQLELIEDFTGVVSISGSTVTITSPTRGVLTTTSTSASFFDQSPPPTNLCPSAPSNCAAAGQVASVDAFLNTDGTFSLKEFEPLNATQQDFIEGTVVAINPTSQTQFTIVTTDKIKAATNSLISLLNTGDVVTVNITNLAQGFLVDSKGLTVQNSFGSSYNLFFGQTNTTAIHPGQTVALHVTAFTAASGNTLAVATADTVILRWTRLRANVFSTTSFTINIDTLPAYFGFTSSSSQAVVQAFLSGPLGTDGVTNLDGVANSASGLTTGQAVGLRVLYFQNAGNTANPAFFAAKIRQP